MLERPNTLPPVRKRRTVKEAAAVVLCAGSLLGAGYDLDHGGSLSAEAALLMIVWLLAYFWLREPWPLAALRHDAGAPAARRPDTPLERLVSWGATLLFALLVIGLSTR